MAIAALHKPASSHTILALRRLGLLALGSQRLDRRHPKPPSLTKVGPEFGHVLRKCLWLEQF
jgi:hypothetical protein